MNWEDGLLAEKKPHTPNMSAPPPTAEAIAIAVKQQNDSEQPPTIIAGGRGQVAEQILEIAFSHGIKVREDADLAQMLSVVDVDSEIPLEAFSIVAEILTYVYEANNAMNPDVPPQSSGDSTPTSSARRSAEEMVANWSANKGELND